MLIKNKFPELESCYSSLNNVPFVKKEYSSVEKLFWECINGHISYKSALEWKRYGRCQSCFHIQKSNIEYNETLEYCYPDIAKKMSLKNSRSADSLRPDSKFNAIWVDMSEKMTVQKRVSLEIDAGNVDVNHIGVKRLLRSKSSDTHADTPYHAELLSGIMETLPCCVDDIAGLRVWSKKKLWWKCEEGHEFQSRVRDIVNRRDKCTVCSGLECQEGVNDISTTHPELARSIVSPPPNSITISHSGIIHFQCPLCYFEWSSLLGRRKGDRAQDVSCSACSGRVAIPGISDLASLMPQVVPLWSDKNSFPPERVPSGSEKKVYVNCSNTDCSGTICVSAYILVRRKKGNSIFLCRDCSRSSGESEMFHYISSLGLKENAVPNDRSLIYPQELDVYIPEKNIAVEFNGIYWHSVRAGKSDTYHYEKWLSCRRKGVALISVWEDDWNYRNDAVKSLLKKMIAPESLKLVNESSIKAEVVSRDIAHTFHKENNVMRRIDGEIHIGIRDNSVGDLLAVSTWKVVEDCIYLQGYCEKNWTTINNGVALCVDLGRKMAQKHGATHMIAISSNSYPCEDDYLSVGFTPFSVIPPSRYYISGGKRIFHGSTSSNELFDCGQTTYRLDFNGVSD